MRPRRFKARINARETVVFPLPEFTPPSRNAEKSVGKSAILLLIPTEGVHFSVPDHSPGTPDDENRCHIDLAERKISNPNSIAKLYSVVCDFANRCINVIYHTPNLGYKGRMELLRQLDVQLLGKYMFAINAKEKIIKKLFALRLIPVLDLMRVTRTKTSDIQELGNN